MNLVYIFVQERKKCQSTHWANIKRTPMPFAETLWLKVQKLSIKKNNGNG